MEILIEKTNSSKRQSVLKEYYSRYLMDIRGLKVSSVCHYFDALNNISRRLKEKNLINENIYEVADIEQLYMLRDILFEDSNFVEANERGKRMYSAALNNYCRFAEGQGFNTIKKLDALDMPVPPESAIVVEKEIWKRSGILRTQALEMADYKCEMESKHLTFVASSTHKPYMEGHHALPMNLQSKFEVSLDVYANIICLCPVCHRKIHLGLKEDRIDMAKRIYDLRAERLENSGLKMDEQQFIEMAISG